VNLVAGIEVHSTNREQRPRTAVADRCLFPVRFGADHVTTQTPWRSSTASSTPRSVTPPPISVCGSFHRDGDAIVRAATLGGGGNGTDTRSSPSCM